MRKIALQISFILVAAFLCLNYTDARKAPKKILVFSKTKGFRHESIPTGIEALKQLGKKQNWQVDATEDAGAFNSATLGGYDAIVLLSNTGDVWDSTQEMALQDYVRKGGGIAGVHAAADCEYDWPWYNQLIGAYFHSHPKIQEARILVNKQQKHPSTRTLPDTWTRTDEWYNFKQVSPAIKTIMTLDEHSYEGGNMKNGHPIAWYQEFEGGKVFYTALGHTRESYSEQAFLEHLEGGIRSVMK
ncbi:ThuA domain-containing protein [Flavihumibacter rivuli]|uniref:ThuA domain-containing protein n=1 Tax=Flavihumibacter rivuli TaxID=2838156 RepID=UPI001BDE1B4F|nr:ThuA domain-containing protein [Flavihumibacter rivuli]ULQ58060.1 ThuA domain-containing protein [Flavihumibacter rivuli]